MKTGWQTKPLGELCRFIDYRGKTPEKTESGLRLITAKNVKMGFLQTDPLEFVHPDTYESWMTRGIPTVGDVLFTTEAPLANVCQLDTDERVVFAQRIIVLQPVDSFLDRTFLKYLLLSDNAQQRIHEKGTGATVKGIKASLLKTVEIGFPPLAEQRRIVGILDEAFEGLATAKANAEQNLQNARALFESHLQAVFAQRGDGWVETKVGAIGKVAMCKRVFKDETTAVGEIPFYKIGTFGKEADAFISRRVYDEYRRKFSFPKKGAVLISAAGTIGRRVRYDGAPAYFQDSNIVWIDNDETKVLNDYLYHFYGACDWNSTKGATISRLYNDNLRQVVVAFPKSLEKQTSLVRTLDAMVHETQRLESLYQRKLAALDELKKSLLHRAFSGQL